MGEQPWGWGATRDPHRRAHAVGFLLCAFILLGCDATALAQYIGPPPILNGPILGTPAPSDRSGEPTGAGAGIAWLLTPSLNLSETYTDNVDLAPRGKARSDLITTISPSLNIVGQTAHVNLALTYDPQLLLFALGTSSPIVQQQLLGTAKIEVYPREVFVDGSASISQAYINNAGAFAPTNLTTNKNLQTVEAVNFSPYILHHLGSYVDTETRYRFSTVSTGAAGIGTQNTNQLISTITGGDYFGLLGWTLTSSYTKTNGLSTVAGSAASNASNIDKLERLDVRYPIYDRLSATGSIGYESIKDPTLTTRPKGVLWDIGLRYDPSPYASVSFSYGHHPEGTDFAFSARYDVSAQTHLNASYTQTIETTQSLIAANLRGLIVGPGGVLIDPRTGLPVTPGPSGPGVIPFSLTNGSFLDKRFSLDATATRGRNTYSVAAYDDRQSDQVGQANTQAIGGTFNWFRQLWPNLTSNLNLGYARISFLDGTNRADNYYTASATFAYTLSPTVTAQLSLVRSDRESNQKQNSLVDDLVTLSVQKRF